MLEQQGLTATGLGATGGEHFKHFKGLKPGKRQA